MRWGSQSENEQTRTITKSNHRDSCSKHSEKNTSIISVTLIIVTLISKLCLKNFYISEMETIERSTLIDHELFGEIMRKESHHDHPIELNKIPRWKQNDDVKAYVDKMGLNDTIGLFISMGYTRNSEVWRKLYRDIGTSLFAYWEVFYWEMNNEEAEEYRTAEIRDERIDEIFK